MAPHDDITRLLLAHADGDRAALDQLLPLVYGELQQMAHGRLRGERADHTLNTTALVHEAYLKLVRLDRMDWQNRAHFFAMASQAMRNVLVDYALRRKRLKRGGDAPHLALDDVQVPAEERLDDLLALNDALEQLERVDPRQARIVECRFFGGLSIDETAHALGVSPATVSRDWSMARAWLARVLTPEPEAAAV